MPQVNPQTGLLRLRNSWPEGGVDEGLQVLLSRLGRGETEATAAARAAVLAGATRAPTAVSIHPVKIAVEMETLKDVHLASVWCVEVGDSTVLPEPSRDAEDGLEESSIGTQWLDRATAVAGAEEGATSKVMLGKAAQVTVIELAKRNQTHFSCPEPAPPSAEDEP